MAEAIASSSRANGKRRGGLLGSRIARLIFASNLAGLAVLIVGAMILNEIRAGLVVARQQGLTTQAQVISSLLADGATVGQPAPDMDDDLARATIRSLALPREVRAKVYDPGRQLVADSFFLSDRVDVAGLPPLREPGPLRRAMGGLSNWATGVWGEITVSGETRAVRTRNFEAEFESALIGERAASQRFSDRGQRIISVSVPVQRVSAVVGVLTLEASDVDEILRAERAALLPFIAVAVLVALLTSALLTLAIARPLRRLALAADRVRSGSSERVELPALTRRRDEIGALAQSVEAMTRALMDRIVANERFAADVAHELKNPLTSIRSAVETAERVQDDPEARETLRRVIASDVKRLDRLITDISNASRLEAEMTRSLPASVNMSEFLADIARTYDAMAGAGDVPVVFDDRTHGAGLRVRAREGPLGQVVRNLVDNARSFSPSDGSVRVGLEQSNRGAQTLARIVVEDDGPGVPPDKLETIFERFYTDRPAGTAFGNNSGLGLSIVRQIVASHRGEVRAENRHEGGARFIVDLPAS